MAGFNILDIVGDPWTEAGTAYGGITLKVTDTASSGDSRFLQFLLNESPRFTVYKNGDTIVSNAAGTSFGGFGMRGDTGAMALTSQWADILRWYWEGSAVGSVAVLHGMGTNRLSIESEGAIVHIANNGRYEFESKISNSIQFVGYQAASADGIPFLFNNHGQSRYPPAVVQMGVDFPSQQVLQIGIFDDTGFTSKAYFDGSGGLYARNVSATGVTGTFRGVSARTDGEITGRVFVGMDRDNNAFLGFGLGNAALDSHIYRAGPNLFSIGGAAAPDRPAIKGIGTAIQGRLGDDSDFCTVQGKLTTDQTAVSETITPDSTLTLYDASGVAYKVACVAA